MPMLMTLRMRFPGMTFPAAAAQPVGKLRHLVEDGMNVGNDISAVDCNCRAARRAQRDVQRRALLRDVDLVAAEHGVDALTQAAFLGKPQQQLQGLIGDPVFRIVEINARGLQRHSLAAIGILGEELPKMDILDRLVMGLQQSPGGLFAQR